MHGSTWLLQEAKARFSQLVNQALENGPQTVTRRGREAAVVVAASDFRPDVPDRPRDFFRRGPYLDGVDTERDRSLPREVHLRTGFCRRRTAGGNSALPRPGGGNPERR